jgi:hypothetical protein
MPFVCQLRGLIYKFNKNIELKILKNTAASSACGKESPFRLALA